MACNQARRPSQLNVEVLIVGSGPLGSTFARKLTEGGLKVFMIDAGPQLSPDPGWHLRNSFLYQRNPALFAHVIDSHLVPLSVPANRSPVPALDPGAFHVDYQQHKGFVRSGQNPDQDPEDNLPQSNVTYCVGGMATHWTAYTPRGHPTIECSDLLTPEEWDQLYAEADKLLNNNRTVFDSSIRNTFIRELLQKAYPELAESGYPPQNLPVACERRPTAPEFITWTGSDTILGEELVRIVKSGEDSDDSKIRLKPMWQCSKVVPDVTGEKIEYAVVKDLLNNDCYHIHAKIFVIAAGAILTPQILFNSEIRPDALGRYLCEQTMAFSQVVLKRSIVDAICKDPRWKEQVEAHQYSNPDDPIPIPTSDPDPQCMIPVSEGHPWHCQVHCGVECFGDQAPNVDPRLIVDLRWFGRVQPHYENRVEFSTTHTDAFSMPQPTFHFRMTKEEGEEAHEMMADMCRAASALGGFLPGSEPAFLKPGTALHITGTCRMGNDCSTGDSVVDTYSRVWQFTNLFLGSCGVIPTGTSCNPTNTAVALAIRSCARILEAWKL